MKKIIYSATLILTLTLGACSSTEDLSPQDILNNAVQTADLSSYYAEYTIDSGDGTLSAKQWVKDRKIRSEIADSNGETSVALNDGQTITSYVEGEKTAISFEVGESVGGYVQPTMQEQMMSIYNSIKDTHNITFGDDAKVAGHDTYHLIATAKEGETLFGDMEFWIDKKTWMPLKSTMVAADVTTTTEYTTYEPNTNIADDVFTLDLPEDVVVQQNAISLPENITTEQAVEKLGNVLVLPDTTGYTIDSIEDMKSDTNEIAINYAKDDALQFTISVFKPTEPLAIEQPMTIRGIEGSFSDDLGLSFLQWEENGLRYNVIFMDEGITVEQFIELANGMVVAE